MKKIIFFFLFSVSFEAFPFFMRTFMLVFLTLSLMSCGTQAGNTQNPDDITDYFVLFHSAKDYPFSLFLGFSNKDGSRTGHPEQKLSSSHPCIKAHKSNLHLLEVYAVSSVPGALEAVRATPPLYLCSNVKDWQNLNKCHVGAYQAVKDSDNLKKITPPNEIRDCFTYGT